MKKCLIICWIGKLPDYFDFWEYSCSNNKDFDFLVFTNNKRKSKYCNIKYYYMDLDMFNQMASKSLNMNINVTKPYKLCDFRPAYGIIFEKYINGYAFWGHCDIDQIFGKISDFLDEKQLKKYDRINKNGHFSLYRNNEIMNNLFKRNGSIANYSEVFKLNENFAFDEYSGINLIAEANGINQLFLNDFADINKALKRYECINNKNYKYQFYCLEGGKLYKVYLVKNKIVKEEKMYLHFQKKNPNMKELDYNKKIGIGYKKVSNFDCIITKELILSFNGTLNYLCRSINLIKYYFIKIKQFISCSSKSKKIWIKQKISRWV